MDKNTIIKGRPPNAEETFIHEKHLESISRQPILMEEVAKQLLTLELAIPGIYATVLKLTSGDKDKLTLTDNLYFVFSFWLVSLICILIALLPRAYRIDQNDITEQRNSFFKAALNKYIWILASIITFVLGIGFALKDLAS